MAANLAKWPSNRRLISKFRPSDGYTGNTVPSAVARGYDLRKRGGHLGNVGLITFQIQSEEELHVSVLAKC